MLPAFALAADNDRFALVIGNSEYQDINVTRLKNPQRDARAIAETLQTLNFNVSALYDATLAEMQSTIDSFLSSISRESVVMVFYAGHGIQYQGSNYLLPVDFNPTDEADLPQQSVSMNKTIEALLEAGSSLRLFFLDACRNNPFSTDSANTTGSRLVVLEGLADLSAPYGTIISYATAPNNVARDGRGEHSPYSQALLDNLSKPGLTVWDMLNQVGRDVSEATLRQQQPWISSSPVDKTFCFANCVTSQAAFNEADRTTIRQITRTFLETFKQQDLLYLAEITNLDSERSIYLNALFNEYSSINASIRDYDFENSQYGATATLIIDSGINRSGSKVYAGEAWKTIRLLIKKKNENWLKPEWIN